MSRAHEMVHEIFRVIEGRYRTALQPLTVYMAEDDGQLDVDLYEQLTPVDIIPLTDDPLNMFQIASGKRCSELRHDRYRDRRHRCSDWLLSV